MTTTTVRARNLGEAVAYSPHLSTFATALHASGVLGTLARGGRKQLARLVRARVVKGVIGPAARHAGVLHTMNGATLTIVKSANGYTVSDGHGHTAAVELRRESRRTL